MPAMTSGKAPLALVSSKRDGLLASDVEGLTTREGVLESLASGRDIFSAIFRSFASTRTKWKNARGYTPRVSRPTRRPPARVQENWRIHQCATIRYMDCLTASRLRGKGWSLTGFRPGQW